MSQKNPLLIGLRAARANLVPGLLVQAAMVAVVLAYYDFPPARGWFAAMAAAKARWGYGFTVLSAMVAGALLPQLLKVATLQRGRVRREDLSDLLFLAVFWSADGIAVDSFYHFQAFLFGPQVDAATVTKKVLVDQFIYNPAFAAPFGMFFYELKHQGYRWHGLSRAFTWPFYRDRTIPALFATWVVWTPVTAAIYSLPPLLQIPLFALALTFWVMLFTYMAAHQHRQAGVPPLPPALDGRPGAARSGGIAPRL